MNNHVCKDVKDFPIEKFHQIGKGKGKHILFIGESPAPNGWRVSGLACYRSDGKILPTGKRLNELLLPFDLTIKESGFTELVKCFVSKRSELESCGEKCFPILLAQLRKKRYKLIVLLGVQTTKIFSKLIKQDLKLGEIQLITLNKVQYSVLPLYHPSPVNPTGHRKNLVIFDELKEKIRNLL